MNVELLKRVADVIVTRPSDFDMDDWVLPVEDSIVDQKEKSCGTTACIAGWVCVLANGGVDPTLTDDGGYGGISGFAARKHLGIDYESASNLFYDSDWPVQYRDAYLDATTDAERAKVAYGRIHHFIQTEGAE